jgi:hypothetical protein
MTNFTELGRKLDQELGYLQEQIVDLNTKLVDKEAENKEIASVLRYIADKLEGRQ